MNSDIPSRYVTEPGVPALLISAYRRGKLPIDRLCRVDETFLEPPHPKDTLGPSYDDVLRAATEQTEDGPAA